MPTARQVINSTKPKARNKPKAYKTPLGEIGYDNPREDIERIKFLREGSVEKVPVNNNDIANKLYVDNAIASWTWTSALTYTGATPGIIYCGDTAGDDGQLFANNVDPKPYIQLDGGAVLYLVGSTDVAVYLGDTAGANEFQIKDAGGTTKASIDSDGNTVLDGTVEIKGSLTYTGTNPFNVYGGNNSGDDTYIYANNIDAQPYIYLLGNATIGLISPGNIINQLGDNAGTRKFYLYDSDGAAVGNWDSDGNFHTDGDISTVQWADYGGAGTIIGWAGGYTANIWYKKVGNTVHVNFFISGTSNAMAASFTLPYTSKNSTNNIVATPIQFIDNAVPSATSGWCDLQPNSSTVNLSIDWTGTPFAPIGLKQVVGQFWYEAA